MAHRISTVQTGLLYSADHIALNQAMYANMYGGTIPGFGILNGCELSSQGTGNTLRINAGRVLLSGVLTEIEQTDIALGSSTTVVNWQVILRINLITKVADLRTELATYTPVSTNLLTSPDANCEISIGRYTFDNGLITNIVNGNPHPQNSLLTGYYQVNARFSGGSYNSTTRIATWSTNADLRNLIKVGSKLKFQSNLGTTYAIVHAITATTITLFHQVGTASLATPSTTLINVGIGRPADFPVNDDNNWTIATYATAQIEITSPTNNTWYNSKQLTLGVGLWKIQSREIVVATKASGVVGSTTETTISDSGTTAGTYKGVSLIDTQGFDLLTGTVGGTRFVHELEFVENITSQKTKYSNGRTQASSPKLYFYNQTGLNYFKATSNYA